MAQREHEATTAAKAKKKSENERKKTEKIECTKVRESGIARIANLEEARQRRNREEDAHLNVTTTRHTYLTLSTVDSAQDTLGARYDSPGGQSMEDSGSEFEDEEASSTSSSESSPEDEDGTPVPQKKVCLTLTFSVPSMRISVPVHLQKMKTNAECKREKQVRIRAEINAAKQASPAPDTIGKRASGKKTQPLLVPPPTLPNPSCVLSPFPFSPLFH